jgi:hypothetical protein
VALQTEVRTGISVMKTDDSTGEMGPGYEEFLNPGVVFQLGRDSPNPTVIGKRLSRSNSLIKTCFTSITDGKGWLLVRQSLRDHDTGGIDHDIEVVELRNAGCETERDNGWIYYEMV